MIGVTIRSGPHYRPMCDEAIDRFKYYTGIEKVVVFDTDRNPYLTKLRLHSFFKQSFVFFDSDLFFVNKCDLSQFNKCPEFIGVKDVGRFNEADFPIHDCYHHGINNDIYLNTGFFIADGSNEKHLTALEYAWNIRDKCIVGDFGEQTFINIGLQRTSTPIKFLPNTYNYAFICEEMKWEMRHKQHDIQDSPYAIHALGFKAEQKLKQLHKYSILKSHELMPLPKQYVPSGNSSLLPG